MWPTRYNADRYFAPRYWPKIGAVAISWTSFGGLYLQREDLYGALATLEVCMRQTTGTVYARLYDVTAAAAVSGSQVSTASGTFVLVESDELDLVDGHEYRAQFGKVSGDAGELYSARLIFE